MGAQERASSRIAAVFGRCLLAAVLVACVLVPLMGGAGPSVRAVANADAHGWQAWGDWQVSEILKIKCRTYVEAVPDGRKLLITHGVSCDHKFAMALNGSVFGPTSGMKGESCPTLGAHESCTITYRVDNPSGSQRWGVVTTSSHWRDPLPEAVIHFSA